MRRARANFHSNLPLRWMRIEVGRADWLCCVPDCHVERPYIKIKVQLRIRNRFSGAVCLP